MARARGSWQEQLARLHESFNRIDHLDDRDLLLFI